MDGLIPWQLLEDRIRPFYPKAGRERQPYPLSVMLRTHCVQLFYNLSDPGVEDLLYESDPVRRFVAYVRWKEMQLFKKARQEERILTLDRLQVSTDLDDIAKAEIRRIIEARSQEDARK